MDGACARVRIACSAALAAVVIVLGGCTAPDRSESTSTEPTRTEDRPGTLEQPTTAPSTTTPTLGADQVCPGLGACLGLLPAGTYTTTEFTPRLTYSVPDDWSNWVDRAGAAILVAPGFTIEGVDAGISDYIGVYSSIAPVSDCVSTAPTGVALEPAAITDWLGEQPGLEMRARREVTIGGLQGFVVDLRLAPAWTGTCPYSNGQPVVPYLAGRAQSTGVERSLPSGQAVRLYLLTTAPGEVLAIEVYDIADAQRLDEYSAIVESFDFAL